MCPNIFKCMLMGWVVFKGQLSPHVKIHFGYEQEKATEQTLSLCSTEFYPMCTFCWIF